MLLRRTLSLFLQLSDGVALMRKQYEIFRNACQGDALRITTVETLGQVEQTLHALAWLESGDYFTRDCKSGEIVAGRNKGKLIAAS
jgi:hypothetical protein